MSSSASRREAARSKELGRMCSGEGPLPRPAPPAKAPSGELLLPKGGADAAAAAAAVRHEGWMVRYGRRKIGRSFFHTRYFVLDNKLLAYYKKQPKDSMIWMRGRVQKEVPTPYVFLVRFAKAASSFSDQKNDKEKIESGCNCFDIPVWPPGMLMKYNEVSSSDYFANGRLERTRSIDGDSVLGAALC